MPYAAPPITAADMQRATGALARFVNSTIPAGNTVTSQTETAFASRVTLPAGLLIGAGVIIEHRMFGLYSSIGVTPSIIPRIRLGGVSLLPTRVITGLLGDSSTPWRTDVEFALTETGIVGSGILTLADNQIRIFGGPAVTGIDLTQPLDLVASAQWGQSGCAITLQGLVVDISRTV